MKIKDLRTVVKAILAYNRLLEIHPNTLDELAGVLRTSKGNLSKWLKDRGVSTTRVNSVAPALDVDEKMLDPNYYTFGWRDLNG